MIRHSLAEVTDAEWHLRFWLRGIGQSDDFSTENPRVNGIRARSQQRQGSTRHDEHAEVKLIRTSSHRKVDDLHEAAENSAIRRHESKAKEDRWQNKAGQNQGRSHHSPMCCSVNQQRDGHRNSQD